MGLVLRAVVRHARYFAAPHGDGGAGVERGLRGRLVRARLEWRVVKVAMFAQPDDRAACRTSDDRLQVRGGRRLCRVEHEPALRVAGIHAVEQEQVEVDVEVQAAEALNEVDRAALDIFEPVAPSARTVHREDRLDEDARERRQYVGLERSQLAKLVGEREHVLPHGHVRQDSIDEVCRDVGHASAAAARTHASAVA